MLQLPNKEIKILMFNKLNDIVEKVDNTHEYMENINKEMETIREDWRITSTGLEADWTQLRRESMTLKMGQQKDFHLNKK